MKLRIKPDKRLYLILALVSISAAAIGAHLLSSFMNPYQLEVLQQEGRDGAYKNEFIIYHDFDKDGYSETVVASNDRKNDKSGLAILGFSRMFVDECNYSEPILGNWQYPWLAFDDINKDGYDELFAFTEAGDSLFLYIHDLRTKQAVLSRHFLLKTERRKLENKGGDFVLSLGGFIDIGKVGGRGFVFTAVSGQQPRGVYLFDTEKLKIVKRFEAEMFPGSLLLYDLTGDGKEEIIVASQAIGNIHYPAKYSDDRCWLFVLDQNLQPIIEPQGFGEYSSRLYCSPIEIDSERFLLLSYGYLGDKNLQDFMCLIDSEGKIFPKRYFSQGIIPTSWGPIVDNRTGAPVFYAASRENNLLMLNEQLSITHEKSTSLGKFSVFESLFPSRLIDLDRNGGLELICRSDKDIQIYDEQLKRLASFPAPSRVGKMTFRETGDGNPLELGLNSDENFYRFAFKKNMLFSFLPLIGFGVAGCCFLLLTGGYKFSALAYTYLSFFRFSLIKTANGVLILNATGRISFLNNRVQDLLALKHPLSKGQHFTAAFEHKPQLSEWIQKGLDSGKPVKEKMSLIQANYQFEGEIRVTPFISSFKLISAYLVEIQDYTQPILSERLQMWSTSVQKIAHDIKTPLSSVALNLKALQMRLENISLPRRDEVNDDIEMMRTELQRVHNMTRNFLKLSNLEKPNLQAVSAREIIQNAVDQFSSFTNGDIQIQSDLDPEVDDLWADPQQIELVFHIVLENAVDALQGTGQINISTSMAQYLDKSFVKFLEFEVSDTGPGIDPNSRDKIFEPYFTTKSDGTGMGLAIARKIIEDHGGVIGLHSNSGLGTVIRFSLPLNENNSSSES